MTRETSARLVKQTAAAAALELRPCAMRPAASRSTVTDCPESGGRGGRGEIVSDKHHVPVARGPADHRSLPWPINVQ